MAKMHAVRMVNRAEGTPAASSHGSARETIRLLPPTFVELPKEDADEIVRLLAEVIRRAIRRRAREA